MNLKPEHFRNMRFPIHGVANIFSVTEVALLTLPEVEPSQLEPILRYTIYMYDIGSPVTRERSLRRRQDLALEISGASRLADFPELPALLRIMSAPGQQDLIAEVLRAQNSDVWEEMQLNEIVRQEIHSRLVARVDIDEVTDVYVALKRKSELLEVSKEAMNRVQALRELFYGSVHEEIKDEIQRIPIRPETAHKFSM